MSRAHSGVSKASSSAGDENNPAVVIRKFSMMDDSSWLDDKSTPQSKRRRARRAGSDTDSDSGDSSSASDSDDEVLKALAARRPAPAVTAESADAGASPPLLRSSVAPESLTAPQAEPMLGNSGGSASATLGPVGGVVAAPQAMSQGSVNATAPGDSGGGDGALVPSPAPNEAVADGSDRDGAEADSRTDLSVSPRGGRNSLVPKWRALALRQEQEARRKQHQRALEHKDLYYRCLASANKREAQLRAMREKAAEEEMQGATFHPEVTRHAKSLQRTREDLEMDAQQGQLRRRALLLSLPHETDAEHATFRPTISRRSAAMVRAQRSGSAPVSAAERLYAGASAREEKLQRLAAQSCSVSAGTNGAAVTRTHEEIAAHVQGLLRFKEDKEAAIASVRRQEEERAGRYGCGAVYVDEAELVARLTHPAAAKSGVRAARQTQPEEPPFRPTVNASSTGSQQQQARREAARVHALSRWFDHLRGPAPALTLTRLRRYRGERSEVAAAVAQACLDHGVTDAQPITLDTFRRAVCRAEDSGRCHSFWRGRPPAREPAPPAPSGRRAARAAPAADGAETPAAPPPAHERLYLGARVRQLERRQRELEEMQRELELREQHIRKQARLNAIWRRNHPPRLFAEEEEAAVEAWRSVPQLESDAGTETPRWPLYDFEEEAPHPTREPLPDLRGTATADPTCAAQPSTVRLERSPCASSVSTAGASTADGVSTTARALFAGEAAAPSAATAATTTPPTSSHDACAAPATLTSSAAEATASHQQRRRRAGATTRREAPRDLLLEYAAFDALISHPFQEENRKRLKQLGRALASKH